METLSDVSAVLADTVRAFSSRCVAQSKRKRIAQDYNTWITRYNVDNPAIDDSRSQQQIIITSGSSSTIVWCNTLSTPSTSLIHGLYDISTPPRKITLTFHIQLFKCMLIVCPHITSTLSEFKDQLGKCCNRNIKNKGNSTCEWTALIHCKNSWKSYLKRAHETQQYSQQWWRRRGSKSVKRKFNLGRRHQHYNYVNHNFNRFLFYLCN